MTVTETIATTIKTNNYYLRTLAVLVALATDAFPEWGVQ
jgi:hypothetical protein